MSLMPFGIFDQPPDIGIPTISVPTTSDGTPPNPSTIYWPWPQIRSTTMYGASSWSTSGCGNVVLAAIDDGDYATKCFDWNVASDSIATVDLGSAQQIQFVRIAGDSTALIGFGINVVEYSDNNSTWTAVSSGQQSNQSATMTELQWASVGSHRYWRFRKNSSSAQNYNFYDVHFGTFQGNYPLTGGYRIYDNRVGKSLIHTIDPKFIPTASAPFVFEPWVTRYNFGASPTYGLIVTVVSTNLQTESGGISVAQIGGNPNVPSFDPIASNTITLANGVNDNIALGAKIGMIEFSGPTLAFSLGGFTGPTVPGAILSWHYNGTQACTIVNESAGSGASSRIMTDTGANIVLAAGKASGIFRYSAVASRWIVLSLRDSTGAH